MSAYSVAVAENQLPPCDDPGERGLPKRAIPSGNFYRETDGWPPTRLAITAARFDPKPLHYRRRPAIASPQLIG